MINIFLQAKKNDLKKYVFKPVGGNNTHFSFLSDQASLSSVKDNIVYMQPSTQDNDNLNYIISIVRIKIGSAYLKELIDFIALV